MKINDQCPACEGERVVVIVDVFDRWACMHATLTSKVIWHSNKLELKPLRPETQSSVSAWAVATFGDTGSNTSCAARANLEMAELLFELACDDRSPKAASEIADVVICLYRLAERLGVDVHEEVDAKMEINRAREWIVKDGHGQHK